MEQGFSKVLKLTVLLASLFVSTIAFAHSDANSIGGGFMTGFMHPILGLDHVIAMVAVGLWGVFLGRPAIWILPIVFPLVMAFGGALGVIGVEIPGIEAGIALSGLVLGLAVVFAVKPALSKNSLRHALVMGGLFGFFTYATYSLTNLTLLTEWTMFLAVSDIVWGGVLGALVSVASFFVNHKFIK